MFQSLNIPFPTRIANYTDNAHIQIMSFLFKIPRKITSGNLGVRSFNGIICTNLHQINALYTITNRFSTNQNISSLSDLNHGIHKLGTNDENISGIGYPQIQLNSNESLKKFGILILVMRI